jgi:putative exporter of polyketide antibiotics
VRRKRRPGEVRALMSQIMQLSRRLEDSSVAEYVEFMRNPRRVIWSNFLAGMARGFGIAIGASVLTALFLYALSVVISLNIPIIGNLIAKIVKIVKDSGV